MSLLSSGKDITAGTVGGIATVLVGHPLDTIKVRLQTQPQANPLYSGALDCALKTWRHEGIRGFYKGMQSPVLGEGFFNAVQFFAWGQSKLFLQGKDASRELSIPEYFLAGGITGFVSCFVECPIDLFKSQLQTQVFLEKPAFTTFPQSVAAIVKENGILGMYQGLTSNFLRTIPSSASYFGCYEATRRLLSDPKRHRDELPAYYVLLAGGVGGFAYWFSTYPFDSIKSAMQSDHYVKSKRQYKGVVDCARQMYQQGGLARFFHGLAPCLLRSFPANAACFFAYEKVRKWLDDALPEPVKQPSSEMAKYGVVHPTPLTTPASLDQQ